MDLSLPTWPLTGLTPLALKDKEFIFWVGLMHETMNEVVRDEVINYVINWVNRHL